MYTLFSFITANVEINYYYHHHNHCTIPHWFNGQWSKTTWVLRKPVPKSQLTWILLQQERKELELHKMCRSSTSSSSQITASSIPTFRFLQARCPSCWATNAVKALRFNWMALWKNRACSTTMKWRKSLVKPLIWHKTLNYIELFGSSAQDHYAQRRI